ncbi:MAG: CPXCG motif-containing cysteine-rich protein [Flavobacteriaceae bacterium]|jgi:hypothetical protein|nr:CPXCG motif-containing cysteine-rich protein [Flavobacteriaceae bacterium]NVJ72907.1 CPXCG motif-containing cysteine-rich protein [Flavobacteriaceae bacterium]
MLEQDFLCPHCWEEQYKLIDPSFSTQEFIEDCEVCCNPISFHIHIEDYEIIGFEALPIGQ